MLVPLMGGDALAQTSSRADRAFEALSRRWLDQSLRLGPAAATLFGDHRFDRDLDDVSAAGRAATLRLTRQTASALAGIDRNQLSRANQVDAALLDNNLRSTLWTIETNQQWAWNTLAYQSTVSNAIYSLMSREFAPVTQRLESATARLEKIPRFLQQARQELQPARVPAPYAVTYAAQNPGVKSIVTEMIDPVKDQLSASKRARLDRAIAAANAAVDEHQHWIDTVLVPAAQADYRVGAEVFDAQLGFTLVTNMTRQQIRQRADAAVISVRAQMYETSRRALAGRPDAPAMPDAPSPEQQQAVIRAAIDLAAAQRPPRAEIVSMATAGVEEAKAFVQQHDLITLPDGPVRVILMPEFNRGVAVAYCDAPGPLDRNLQTYYVISPIPDDWTEEQATSFLREYNTRGLLEVGVHEAMPGHYVQIFHSNTYPSTLRALLQSGSFVEGWACYAEQMMIEQGFRADDPLFKLTQLKVQLRTICNSIIDQAIHVDGMTQEEMMHLLTQTAFQEEREAAGKWRRAQLSFGQLSTYFVGLQEHLEARAEAQRRQGAAFNLKAYHDGILSFGSPPMRYARALYLNEAIV